MTMTTLEFAHRYSVATHTTSALPGIVIHQLRTPNGRWFGAVEDRREGWCYVIPMHSQFAADHFWRTAAANLVDAVEKAAA